MQVSKVIDLSKVEPSKHGCYNRPPFKQMVECKGKSFPFTMSMDCQYSKGVDDARCSGCINKQAVNIVQ